MGALDYLPYYTYEDYMKVCDATDETVEFELKECDEKLEFDFSKI